MHWMTRRFPHLASVSMVCLVVSACCTSSEVRIPPIRGGADQIEPFHGSQRAQGDRRIYAGLGEVDITPPVGLQGLGWSLTSEKTTYSGYRVRLHARVLAMEDAEGDRVALVVADLGMASALLQREIASRVRLSTGITVDRLMLAATHTHSGPAGFCSNSFYNTFGSPSLRPGYEPKVVEFLATRISETVIKAAASMAPVTLSVGESFADGLTRNRSYEAYQMNPDAVGLPGVDGRAVSLCISSGDGLLGAFSFFAGHPNVVDITNDVWHADAFGVATHKLASRYGGVFAIANTSVGDTSFTWNGAERGKEAGHNEAVRLGGALAGLLQQSIESARPIPGTDVAHIADEYYLPEAEVEEGKKLSRRGLFGRPTLAGGEDGRSTFYPWLVREGMTSKASGDQKPKSVAFTGVLQPMAQAIAGLKPPTRATVQLIRIGDLCLVGMPFETTTQLARRIRRAVAKALPLEDPNAGKPQNILVVGPANEYIGYCTTYEEYQEQHYEGSSTIYGPHQGRFFRLKSADLARCLPSPGVPCATAGYANEEAGFEPGCEGNFWPVPVPTPDERAPVPTTGEVREQDSTYKFVWRDLDPSRIRVHEGWLVRVEKQHGADWREVANDLGLDFVVRWTELSKNEGGGMAWQATWDPNPECTSEDKLRFRVAKRCDRAEITSACFHLSNVRD